ncbi:hypothetical protein [Oceanobacillus sp. FSL H7-0719]|uniref:hypothetical protein n=1 Tax=Oceanobacillus sp. FSL H7-0719 TaxID=2954507 RepID=UPI00325446DA
MDFTKINEELKALQDQVKESKVDTRFEKNKLYDYLGKSLVNDFRKFNVFIAGGLVTSLFTGNEINDVDVYFRNEDDLVSFLENFYGNYIISHTKKATMFADKNKKNDTDIKIQAIHFKYFETAEDIFDTFDFTHVMGAFDFKTEEFVLHKDFLKHNSQRILKFNRLTDFPLISLIRVKKYQDRDYTISKPELMRIAMTCMDLEINSYEELEEHLGGMYGEAWDNIVEEIDKDEEFSLSSAVDKLQDLNLNEDYFKMPKTVSFNSADELIESACNVKPKFLSVGDNKFKISYDGESLDSYYQDIPEESEVIDGNEYFKDKKFYKFVRKVDDKYFSFYDGNFEYRIGEVAKADNYNGLYFNELKNIRHSSFSDREDKVLIEVTVDGDGLISSGTDWRFKRCEVVREVPVKEWEQYAKSTFDNLGKDVPF